MARIVQLDVADAPEAWNGLGFAVDHGICVISAIRHQLAPRDDARGVTAWALAGVGRAPATIDGLATSMADDSLPNSTAGSVHPNGPVHPNGVVGIDHVVVSTPDVDRTVAALDSCGLELRRRREADTQGRVMRQAFYKLGEVILEIIGPQAPGGDGPARFLGLAFTCADLDATAAYLGDRLHPAKDAVQPGRQIATLDRAAGSSVAMAFMSP